MSLYSMAQKIEISLIKSLLPVCVYRWRQLIWRFKCKIWGAEFFSQMEVL